MHFQAYLLALYLLGCRYHSGQWSKGYAILCHAQEYAHRVSPGWNMDRTLDQLRDHTLYPSGSPFRNAVAFQLNKLRKYRWKL